ncbi:MAG: VCBS repeat-containing protein [Planctomycetales bacterium]|nr:VCBS repeat-containing protein [Planctomycetales bacterium]
MDRKKRLSLWVAVAMLAAGCSEQRRAPLFEEVTEAAGLAAYVGMTHGVAWGDFDGDDRPDLYVTNHLDAPLLFRNLGNGKFAEVTQSQFDAADLAGDKHGAQWADFNNDGQLDLIATDMSGSTHYKRHLIMGDLSDEYWFMDTSQPRQIRRNSLFVNVGHGHFIEAACLAGVADTDWTWSPKLGDLDCDGFVDLFISNGMTRDWLNSDLIAQSEREGRLVTEDDSELRRDTNFAFRNRGDLRFDNIGEAWALAEARVGFAAAMGDLDNDGDLDLVVNNFDEEPSVLRNDLEVENRVIVHLLGDRSNRHGLGAIVTASSGEWQQAQYVTASRGFMASDTPVAHFGLGAFSKIDQLTVRWPSGIQQTIKDLEANYAYTIREGEAVTVRQDSASLNNAPPHPPLFVRNHQLAARHVEQTYDDFGQQPLLPRKLSQLGPGLAVADVNGDGVEDLFVGGGTDSPGSLWVSSGNSYQDSHAECFAEHRLCEDMGAIFFDVDNDDDMDLYVVSGGVECSPGSELLRDRLYLNSGNGQFVLAPTDALPDVRDSGGCVAACDYDHDGDIDLFVGGRTVPGKYPLPPTSRLLRNETDADSNIIRFVEVAAGLPASLTASGMVTSAVWSDVDNDGHSDLLVTYEWGPIRCFLNKQGALTEATVDAGLSDVLGWWNGITGGDIDNDGDMDFVVTNFGWNSPYFAARDQPLSIYYGDFGHNDRMQVVETMRSADRDLPLRRKEMLQSQLPFIADQVPTYHDYAMASIDTILGESVVADANVLSVNNLSTGALINDGTGRFHFQPFPRLAQVAPSFGAQLVDVDDDGFLDVYLVQNFSMPNRDIGRTCGGVSQLLIGNGDGTFQPMTPASSGLIVSEDARSVIVTDANRDGWPDFVVGVNNDHTQLWERRSESASTPAGELERKGALVRLSAPDAIKIGARVTVRHADGRTQSREVHCGEGYLSQSTRDLFFTVLPSPVQQIEVRWADGQSSVSDVQDGRFPAIITR